MNADNLYLKLNFRQSQLDAIVKIYDKYFSPKMPDDYQGKGIIGLWGANAKWETGKGQDANHNHVGIISNECREDPLWQEFSDILPFMAKSATITKMPAGDVMIPHVDRKWRPNSIYFPIHGCSDKCISEYYDLPKPSSSNSIAITTFPPAKYSYSISTHAYLTNTHEWHGVRNKSNTERIAFGWNFLTADYNFEYCKHLITKSGYVHPDQN